MPPISEYVDQTELGGGRFRNEIAMKPIGVRENGTLVRLVQDFADGDATFSHTVNRAPLRVRIANDGMRRFFPILGNDSVYFEMGAPFVQIGGNWTQVDLGTPRRSEHTLTWTRPQTITTIVHGGHFVDLRIELLNGYVPENSRIAFPVGLAGVTRSGMNIQRGGVAVARLLPFAIVDAAAPLAAPRPISHSFTTIGGQSYVVLTLPSLVGVARPVIDPTVEIIMPTATGKDTVLYSANPNTAHGSSGWGFMRNNGSPTSVALHQFDTSSIPTNATVNAGSVYIAGYATGAFVNFPMYQVLRNWVEAEATWNVWSTGNSWTTAGCFGIGTDRDDTVLCTIPQSANQGNLTTAGIAVVQGWVNGNTANYGFAGMSGSSHGGEWEIAMSEQGYVRPRPKLTVEYTEAAVSSGRMMMTGVG